MKKILKKNQIVIYVIALMLVFAGYLNFTTKTNEQSVETSMQTEANDDMQIADIGDAKLVNSDDAVTNKNINNQENIVQNNETKVEKSEEKNTEETKKDDEKIETSSNVEEDYFTKSKLERDTMYSQMIESYENVLNSNNSLETQKQSATEEIKKINDTKNSIMVCENLISTKGFANNIVFVNGDSVSAIIGQKEELKQEQVAQIQNIISRELNAKIENIHISVKK